MMSKLPQVEHKNTARVGWVVRQMMSKVPHAQRSINAEFATETGPGRGGARVAMVIVGGGVDGVAGGRWRPPRRVRWVDTQALEKEKKTGGDHATAEGHSGYSRRASGLSRSPPRARAHGMERKIDAQQPTCIAGCCRYRQPIAVRVACREGQCDRPRVGARVQDRGPHQVAVA